MPTLPSFPTSTEPAAFLVAALVPAGLCLGSFLNVVIHRLPAGRSLIKPRSHCPHCRTPVAVRDNIPLLSYLLLRGRCRECSTRISPRYPTVEALGAVCILAAFLASDTWTVAALRTVFLLTMLAVLFIDREHRIIPDEITLPGVAIGLLVCPLLGVARLDALIGAVAGAGGLWLLATLYRAVRKIDGLGMGDVKLAGMLGAWLGWQGLVLTLFAGSILGSLVGIALIATGRGGRLTALPFGSFLAPAAALTALYGQLLWSWYLSLGI